MVGLAGLAMITLLVVRRRRRARASKSRPQSELDAKSSRRESEFEPSPEPWPCELDARKEALWHELESSAEHSVRSPDLSASPPQARAALGVSRQVADAAFPWRPTHLLSSLSPSFYTARRFSTGGLIKIDMAL